MNDELLFGDNKCVVRCSHGHILDIHTRCEGDLCQRLERDLLEGRRQCRDCAWSDSEYTGTVAGAIGRGYIR